jgi:hypothetical protein
MIEEWSGVYLHVYRKPLVVAGRCDVTPSQDHVSFFFNSVCTLSRLWRITKRITIFSVGFSDFANLFRFYCG